MNFKYSIALLALTVLCTCISVSIVVLNDFATWFNVWYRRECHGLMWNTPMAEM